MSTILFRAVRRLLLLAASAGFLLLLYAPCGRVAVGNAEGTVAGAGTPELIGGQTMRGEISRGAVNRYAVNLAAGQRLQLLIDKGDLQISLALYAPTGRLSSEFTSRLYGPLEVSHLADESGPYVLELSSLETEGGGRGYELRVGAVRAATARAAAEDRAVNASAEAGRLRALWHEQAIRQAGVKYVEAAEHWSAAGQRRRAALALDEAAGLSFILSDYARARGLYLRALKESRGANDRLGEASALGGLAQVLSYLGGEQEALRYAERGLARLGSAPAAGLDDEVRRGEALALCNVGEAYYSLGDLKKALDSFDRSIALSIAAGDRGGEAQARLKIGYAYSDSGLLDDALSNYRRAQDLWRAVGDRRGQALALNAIGGVHASLGERQHALELNRQAADIFGAVGDRQGEAVALNGIARVYEEMNEPAVALDNYTHAFQLYERNGARSFACATEYCIGQVYRTLGRPEQALAHYERSLALSRQTHKRRLEAYAAVDIAGLHITLGREGRALVHYTEALKLFERIGDRHGQAKALGSIAGVHAAAGRVAEALKFYGRALSLNRLADDRDAEAASLYQMADAARRAGDLGAALSHAESSVGMVESLRVKVASPNLRASYFASVHKYYGLYIELLMEMHRARPSEGFDARALEASERSRARSFIETLPEAKAAARRAPPELLARADELSRRLGEKAQINMREPEAARREDDEQHKREIRRLTTEYAEVQARIREQQPAAEASPAGPKPLGLREIQAELDADTLLLEYELGEEKSYLWAVTPTSLDSFELPGRAAVESKARRLYELLVARQPAPAETPADYLARVRAADEEYAVLAAELSRGLLGPVGGQLGDKRLLVVADGQLQYIPFDALPSPQDDTHGAAHEPPPPLVIRNEVVSLPSVSALAALRREGRERARAPKLVAVLADPVFERDDPRLRPPARPEATEAAGDAAASPPAPQLAEVLRGFGGTVRGSSGLSRLPATLREANAILDLTPRGSALAATGFDASRATATSAELGRYRIVHFATHGIINDEHPELSGIVLSMLNERGGRENGFLQLHDIYNLRLSSDLVVLSACDTGLGKDVRGEGLVGITRGFMFAGSKSIVASLWRVDDEATSTLMVHFYRAMLRDGLRPAAALRAAKEAMWRQPQWRAPFYWAAFVIQGEYRERIRAEDEVSTLAAPSLIFALLAGGAFALWRLRARRRGH